MTSSQTLSASGRLAAAGKAGDRPVLRLASTRLSQRKLVTVMFVDVMGSMDLSREIELEAWGSLIGGLFELMCESVYQFGGWVANFTGDGVEAVFEAAGASNDHARQACYAALWLRDAIREPAGELSIEHGLELSVRIGINSGDVLTGTIGSRYKRYYTANGYAVALAKRMETLARPGQICLTEHTAALVAGVARLRELGAFEVKGADTRVGVVELVGRAPRARHANTSRIARSTHRDRR
jgi:class 3 adenylate cyclase